MGEHATVHATMRIAVLGVVAAVQFGLCLQQLTDPAVGAFVALALVTATCAVWVVRRKPLPLTVVVPARASQGNTVRVSGVSAGRAIPELPPQL